MRIFFRDERWKEIKKKKRYERREEEKKNFKSVNNNTLFVFCENHGGRGKGGEKREGTSGKKVRNCK